MDKGPYQTSPTYTMIKVMLLCWEHSYNDIIIKTEIDDLKATFEGRFRFHTEIRYLDFKVEQKIQVRLDRVISDFINKHDGPNTLLIVYYAGHWGKEGNLESLKPLVFVIYRRHIT